ncbi:MAG: flagellar biosynthetic protein FliR [Pseudomonadota bacterium]|nr:flagellar biosynthetic protein FliR [Pseudomonadota bacterium]
MGSLYQFAETEMLAFILVFLRVVSFMVSWAILGTAAVPMPVKILTSLVITFVLFPVIGWKQLGVDLSSGIVIFLAAREVAIGLTIGFFTAMFFQGIAIGGQIISMSMGLSSAQVFNPTMNVEGSAVEQFKVMLGSLFFLFINGHHHFLSGFAASFKLVPISTVGIDFNAFAGMGPLIGEVMVIGIKVAAPVMISIFFVNIAMGIVGRAVPQINVLVTSLPANILVGLATLIVSLPLFSYEMREMLESMTTRLFEMMKNL